MEKFWKWLGWTKCEYCNQWISPADGEISPKHIYLCLEYDSILRKQDPEVWAKIDAADQEKKDNDDWHTNMPMFIA